MNKKVIGFLCGVAACSVLTACSGQEASPTAASVSQSMPASSESIPVSLNNPATQSFDKWVAASEASLNQRYEQALEGFTKAEGKIVHGFQVYTNEAGDEYIISGVTPVKLRDGNIPESAAQNLRTQKTYQKVILTDQSTTDYIKESYEYFKDSLEKSTARSFDQYVSTEYDFTGLNVDHVFINNIPIDIDPVKANLNSGINLAIERISSAPEFKSKLYMDVNNLDTILVMLGDSSTLKYTPASALGEPRTIERTYADGTTETFEIILEEGEMRITHSGETDVSTILAQDYKGNTSYSANESDSGYFSLVDLCNSLQVYIDYSPSESEDGSGGIINFITDTYDLVMPDHVYAIEGDGTDLTTEYKPEAPEKELTPEEASVFGDPEALEKYQYQSIYDRQIAAGATPEEAAAFASSIVEQAASDYEDLMESNEQYLAQVEEESKQRQEEFNKEFEETYGMSYEEYGKLTWQEQNDLRRELVRSGKLPKGGVG